MSSFRQGLQDGVPIALGYVPVGVTFGLVAIQQGFSIVEATLSSVLIFSGAAQFTLVGLLGSGTPGGIAWGLCLLLNTRHLLYGPSLAAQIPASPLTLAVLAHGLTDEVFAVALARLEKSPPAARVGWLVGVEVAAYGSWVGATVMGSLGGGWIMTRLPLLAQALPFALPALFGVLVMPYLQTGHRGQRIGLGVAVIGAALLSWMGYPAAGILGASLAGAVSKRIVYEGRS